MLMVAKGAVLALFAFSGFLLGFRQGYELYGLVVGTAFGIITTFSDQILRKVDFGTLVGGLIGLASGFFSQRFFLCRSISSWRIRQGPCPHSPSKGFWVWWSSGRAAPRQRVDAYGTPGYFARQRV